MKISRSFLRRFLTIGFFCMVALPALAAVSKSVKNPRYQWLLREGTVRGGFSNDYVSLLDVRHTASKKVKAERVVIDWGDRILEPSLKGGYYQVEYHPPTKSQPARVIVNLGLAINSRIPAAILTEKFKTGVYIKQARLEFDPISQAENLIFELRRPMRVRVSSYPGRPGKAPLPAHLAVDLVE